jgi:electron transport complex protein RnfD
MIHSPYVRKPVSVQRVMGLVLLALVPGIAAYVWFIGAGILVNLRSPPLTAVAAEAADAAPAQAPDGVAVTDLSAVVTAWLVALCFPPIVPWWLTVCAVLVAIVAVKHLYGGLGQNPFNPAMVAYCSMIVAFPALMSQWPPPASIWLRHPARAHPRRRRAISTASPAPPRSTPAHRPALRRRPSTCRHCRARPSARSAAAAGSGSRSAMSLGGLFLLANAHHHLAHAGRLHRRAGAIAGLFWLSTRRRLRLAAVPPRQRRRHARRLLHRHRPGLGRHHAARQAALRRRHRLIAWLIRNFGAYPDGIAFGVLLMNICVPLLDMKTQPRVFGHRQAEGGGK